MKKIIVAVVFAAILTAGSPLFAQQNQNSREGRESDYYYVNLSLEKIFPYRAGYVVQYRHGLSRIATVYIPMSWFTHAAAKGEIVKLPRGQGWPSMSVYYKDGEFSHVRLYVHAMHSHSTWGNIPQTVNLDSHFEGVETIQLEF